MAVQMQIFQDFHFTKKGGSNNRKAARKRVVKTSVQTLETVDTTLSQYFGHIYLFEIEMGPDKR